MSALTVEPHAPDLDPDAVPPIVVYPHERIFGWSGDPATEPDVYPVVDAVDALTTPHPTDAHGHGLLIPAGPEAAAAGYRWEPYAPRLLKSAVAPLLSSGQEPRVAWAFVDVDNADHRRWTSLDEGAAAVRALVGDPDRRGAGPLASAGWYVTRGGFRLIFRLADPVPVTRYADFADRLFGALTRTAGLPVVVPPRPGPDGRRPTAPGGIDSTCGQWWRLYRLPRVVRDGVPLAPPMDLSRPLARPLDLVPVARLRRDAPDAPPSRTVLAPSGPVDPTAAPAPLPGPGAPARGLRGASVGEPPPYPLTPDDVPGGAATWSTLAAASGGMGVGCYLVARQGAPLATRGDRNNAMIRAIGEVVAALVVPGETPDALALARTAYAVLARSVAAWTDGDAPTLPMLWDRCVHFAAKKANEAALRAIASTDPIVLYSVAGPNRYFVWDDQTGNYEGPFNAQALVPAIERHAGTLGLVTRTSTGRPREAVEIVADYGAPIRLTVARLGATATTYDRDRYALVEAAAPLVPEARPGPTGTAPAAAYDAEVDTWLRLLGGATLADPTRGEGDPSVGRWLDWLATVTRTDAPSAAVYLRSPPSTGKGMLALALARLWGAAAPCAYADAVAEFNAGITACPLVCLDEGLGGPLSVAKAGGSAAFRSLVSESSRRLSRKFQEVAVIEGSPRVLVTANNDDALALRERMTPDDVRAVADRILYLRASDDAATYLARLGGRASTAEWVGRPGTLGRIARHVLYLAGSREVVPGPRFVVHGILTDYHRDLAVRHGIVAEALAAVAHALTRERPPTGIAVDADAGKVYVNVQALRRVWPTAAVVPAEHALANALSTIAEGARSIDFGGAGKGAKKAPLRAFVISARDVLRVAEELQIGDPAALSMAWGVS